MCGVDDVTCFTIRIFLPIGLLLYCYCIVIVLLCRRHFRGADQAPFNNGNMGSKVEILRFSAKDLINLISSISWWRTCAGPSPGAGPPHHRGPVLCSAGNVTIIKWEFNLLMYLGFHTHKAVAYHEPTVL